MEDIVTRLFKKGKLVTPEALDYINSKKLEEVLLSEITETIITKVAIEKASDIRILKNITSKKKELTAEDFTNFYNIKLEKIREIILQRTQKNFVSVNKLDTTRQEVYVVGIVKDIKNREKTIVELEDVTGTVQVILEKTAEIELDDVIAVKAVSGGKVLFGQQVIYPEMPLRKPSTGRGKACFISDLHLNETPPSAFEKLLQWLETQPIDAIFVAGDIGEKEKFEDMISQYCVEKTVFVIPGELDKEEEYPQTPLEFTKRNIISLSNPAMVEFGGINILIIHNMDMQMLKKRYLGESKQIMHSDHLVLDIVPDIVHFGHSHEPQVTNYKSVTMVNSGSLLGKFAPVIIDLATREAFQDTSWDKS
ncbi:MAG: metallophosphoesterase family protein [Candidatus Aenigmarchaeota archaeon]|nr:metallophosphoesterase family protein [Candidatus Aenigmarchaeota archaeon]